MVALLALWLAACTAAAQPAAPAATASAPDRPLDLRLPAGTPGTRGTVGDSASPRPYGSGYESRGLAEPAGASASGAERGSAEGPAASRAPRSIWTHRSTVPVRGGGGGGGGRGRR